MEMGESVAAARGAQASGECAICSKKHSAPKKAKFEPVAPNEPKSKWGRVPMTGVLAADAQRNVVYPANAAPSYPSQGHHCIALSALVRDANTDRRKDRRLRLNYYLKKIGFYPNQPSNCIQLPARRSRGDFDAFWQALDARKPLQLHGPGHDEGYFLQCDALLLEVVECIKGICEELDEQEVLDELKKVAKWAENYAFRQLAACDSAWDLHPDERLLAENLYFRGTGEPGLRVTKAHGRVEIVKGRGNVRWALKYPRLRLDCGPLA
jgi:hypothetical protein